MIRELRNLICLLLMCVAGISQRVTAQVEKVDYVMSKVAAVDRLRGVSDEAVEPSSPIATYIILGVFLIALAGLAITLNFKQLKSIINN